MANFFNTPLFGLTLSVLAYTIGLLIYRRFPNPLTTPLLVSTALIIVILHYTGISYKDYYVGGSYLNSLIIPSTVALAVPFYKNLHLMRHHYKSILIGSTVACILNTTLPFQREWVRPSMEFYLHFSLLMARSPGFGSNTTD